MGGVSISLQCFDFDAGVKISWRFNIFAHWLIISWDIRNQFWWNLIAIPLVSLRKYIWKCELSAVMSQPKCVHDDVIKWKHFPRYWPFLWGIQRSPVNSSVTGEFPAQRPVKRSLDVFFDLRLMNGRLSKQSLGCRFGKPSRSLWRHCNIRLQML